VTLTLPYYLSVHIGTSLSSELALAVGLSYVCIISYLHNVLSCDINLALLFILGLLCLLSLCFLCGLSYAFSLTFILHCLLTLTMSYFVSHLSKFHRCFTEMTDIPGGSYKNISQTLKRLEVSTL
jgi:hypothetical protein